MSFLCFSVCFALLALFRKGTLFLFFVSRLLGGPACGWRKRKKNTKIKNTLSTRGCAFSYDWAREECPTHTHHTLDMRASTLLVATYIRVMHNVRLYVHNVHTMIWACHNTSQSYPFSGPRICESVHNVVTLKASPKKENALNSARYEHWYKMLGNELDWPLIEQYEGYAFALVSLFE